MTTSRQLLWAGMFVVLCACPVLAQSVATATLTGAVTDESGGALPGVDINVTHTGTGSTRFVTTDERGNFAFSNLGIGAYKLTAKLSGFTSFEQTGITLNVGDTRSVKIVLTLGTMTETVVVSADATLVQTQSLSVGQVTPQELIVGLPLNGRSATQLLLLEGGAVLQSLSGPGRAFPGTVRISVAGGTGTGTLYLVDGGYNNNPDGGQGNVMPFPDALQEFRTESGVRDARYGMSSAATVNAVTKSGSNEFRGNAFDFVRNHAFNSIAFFNKKENGGLGLDDGLNRHQFGGTIGGPVKKDKLFFFVGIQATINNVRPADTNNIVPTAEVLRGDFRRIMSAACRGTARTLGAPFVDNQVDPALFHPLSLKILTMVPVADPALDPDGCGRYPLALPDNSKDQQYVSRVDYQVTSNKRVFFRDFFTYFKSPAVFDKNKPNLLHAQRGAGNRALMHTIASGLDYVVTPRLFSATRFSFQHTQAIREVGEGVPTLGMMGVNAWMYTIGQIPGQDMNKNGLWNSGNTGRFYADTPQISQDFDWSRGSHTISFGGSWTRPYADGDGPAQADGEMFFTGLITSGTAQASGGLNLADFMLGYPERFWVGGSQINQVHVHSPGVYVNDVWRANPKLTLNYGLRWEPYLAPIDRNGFATGFRRENFDKGIRSVVYRNAPVGLVFNGDPGFPTNNANSYNNYNQLAPRFGIVWDPTGDNRQTLRSGFGIYYDTATLWTQAHHMSNSPFGNFTNTLRPATCPGKPSRNGCPIDFLDPWNATPGGDPMAGFAHQGEPVRLPGPDARFTPNGTYYSMPVDAKPMRSYQYNLSYQRQLLTSLMVDVTYTGNETRNIWVPGYAENPSVYIPGNCTPGQFPGVTAAAPACSNATLANIEARTILRLLNPVEGAMYGLNTSGLTGVLQANMNGVGHYHGLKIGIQKRMRAGWSANANYTLSKCRNQGDPSGGDISWSIPVAQKDPFTDPHPDLTSAEGPCNNDRRHLFNLSSVLISPGLGGGLVNLLTKDWQVGLIFQARSGSPLTPGLTDDVQLTRNPNQRPNVVAGVDPYVDEPYWVANAAGFNTRLQWINMAAFANPAVGQLGDAKRGTLYGPGFWNTDLAFSRNINLAAGPRIELRVEAFNLFNNVNWGNPNVTVGNVNAGQITTTSGDPRIMQFAVKYSF